MNRLIYLAVILLVLTGCVHYDEELWLNRDGSGKAKLVIIHNSPYDNSEEIMRKAELKGIHLQDYSVKKSGKSFIYTIRFRFDSIEAFNNVNDQVGDNDFWGKITLNKEKGRRISFKRSISLGDQADENDLWDQIFRAKTKDDMKWNYKVHLPWKIVSSNAHKADFANRTLSWSYDTNKLWNKTEVMNIEVEKGFPWLILILGTIIFFLIVTSLFWLVRIARKSHLMDWIHHQNEQKPPQA